MIPAHEALGRKSLTEQARMLGQNVGDRERMGSVEWDAEVRLAVLLRNSSCAREHLAIREAFDAARLKANPPYRYVVRI